MPSPERYPQCCAACGEWIAADELLWVGDMPTHTRMIDPECSIWARTYQSRSLRAQKETQHA